MSKMSNVQLAARKWGAVERLVRGLQLSMWSITSSVTSKLRHKTRVFKVNLSLLMLGISMVKGVNFVFFYPEYKCFFLQELAVMFGILYTSFIMVRYVTIRCQILVFKLLFSVN